MACVTGYKRVPDPPARMIPLYPVFEACIIARFFCWTAVVIPPLWLMQSNASQSTAGSSR